MSKTFIVQGGVALLLIGVVFFGIQDVKKKTGEVETEAQVASAITTETITTNQETTTNMEQERTRVIMKTSKGDIEILLFNDLAPKTVENFLTLAQNSFYNGTRFHRVIEGFMIQGGDPLSKDTAQMARWGTGGPGYQFTDEIHAENQNVAGTISMANAGPNTNGSQFFINVADNSYLDTKHTVFGKVVEGYDIVETISLVDTVPGVDRPVEDVIIESIEIK